MRISEIKIKNYKRFTDFSINGLPSTAKLILVVGPNGSGKSSLFDSFYFWYNLQAFSSLKSDESFNLKDANLKDTSNWYNKLIEINFHDIDSKIKKNLRGKFYFRTAYRNETDFTITQLKKQSDPTDFKFKTLSENDVTVSDNYQRLISKTLTGVYNKENDNKSVETLREELIGKIRDSVNNIFSDLVLSSIGDPLGNGSFFFDKGTSKEFHYKNLSSGEKSVFDIILDILIKSDSFPDSVFCIDEPEAHIHTRLQASLLQEIYNLMPETSQLWLTTHSIGMLNKARELEQINPGSVVFLDFDGLDLDEPVVISPSNINKPLWKKFTELALDDFSKLISPKRIIFCEGTSKGRKYKDFDAQVFSKIFDSKYPDTTFISIGSATELENPDNHSINTVKKLLDNSEIIKIVDRDDKSTEEIKELKLKGLKVLKERHIESYLLNDEIIIELCKKCGKEDKIEECLKEKQTKIQESISRGNPADDIKSASGDIYISLKQILQLNSCGNTKDAFFRDTIVPLITPETETYKRLEKEIFK